MEPETYYARSGGLRIAYQVTGEGPDLVMVPGLTSHLEIQWRDLKYRRFVRSLSSFCRLVRFDKPGTGLSDPERTTTLVGRGVLHGPRVATTSITTSAGTGCGTWSPAPPRRKGHVDSVSNRARRCAGRGRMRHRNSVTAQTGPIGATARV